MPGEKQSWKERPAQVALQYEQAATPAIYRFWCFKNTRACTGKSLALQQLAHVVHPQAVPEPGPGLSPQQMHQAPSGGITMKYAGIHACGI